MKFVDLRAQYLEYKKEIDREILEILDSANFILGEKVETLERIFAEYVGIKYALGVSSGTDALLMSLMAMGVKQGDEVITTPFTFVATAEVIALLGAKPVFADIREGDFNIDPKEIAGKITDKTKGIIAVDIFGEPSDYDELKKIADEYKLFLIEDAAQSFGAEYKGKKTCSLCDIGCTSFFPAKPLGCYGDGGMIFTDNPELYETLKSIRVHGQGSNKYDNVRIGINGRLDAIQAGVLLVKIKYFEKELQRRKQIAEFYREKLKEKYIFQEVSSLNKSAYAQFCLIPKNGKRDDILKRLKKNNIPFAIYYPTPLHLMRSFSYLGYEKGGFPVSESISQKIFAIPMHPFLKEEELNKIVGILME